MSPITIIAYTFAISITPEILMKYSKNIYKQEAQLWKRR